MFTLQHNTCTHGLELLKSKFCYPITVSEAAPWPAVRQPLLLTKCQLRLPATHLCGEGEAAFLLLLPSYSVLGSCLVCPGQWA